MSITRNAVIGVAVVAAAYSGAAWYMGTKVEPEIHKQVARFNTTLATHYADEATQLKVVSYKRHWFSSDVAYELLIDDGQEQYPLLFEDNLRHGPLPMAALLKGHFAPLLAYSEMKLLPSQSVQPWFDATAESNVSPITAHSFIEFNGSNRSLIDLAAVDYQSADGDQVTMQASTITVDYKAGKDQVLAEMTMPSFVLVDGEEDVRIALQDIRFDGHIDNGSQEQRSAAQLYIEKIGVDVEGSTEVVIDKLSAKSSYQLQDTLVDSAFYYDLAGVWVDGHDLGQIELDVEAKRIDYEVLTLLAQAEQMDALSEADLQPYLEQFFSHQPELKISPLRWQNTAGKSHFNADVKMAATAVDPYGQNEVDLAHFFDAVDLDVSLSRSMLNAIFTEDDFTSNLMDMLFAKFAKQGEEAGLLTYDGNEAALSLTYDAATDVLTLNGKPTDPNELFYSWLLLQMGGF